MNKTLLLIGALLTALTINAQESNVEITHLYMCRGHHLSIKTIPQQPDEFQWGAYITMNTSVEECEENAFDLNLLAVGKKGSYRAYLCSGNHLTLKTFPLVSNETFEGEHVMFTDNCEKKAVILNKAMESKE